MISSSITKYLLLSFCLLGGILTAQEVHYDRFSIEATTGVHLPISPINDHSASEFIGLKQFQVGGRFMISEKYGLKAHYGYNDFEDPDNSSNGITFHRFAGEGVVNLSKLVKLNYTAREHFVLLAHGGAGLTFAIPSMQNQTDHIGNLLVGLTGEIKLNNRFSILADATYITNLRQHHYFDGASFAGRDYQTGSFMNFSVGLSYSLGKKMIHADWY